MSDHKDILDKFNSPGEAFQEAIERFNEIVSYMKTNTSIEEYQLNIYPNVTKAGVIEGYFMEGLIKAEKIEVDEDDGEEYPVSDYLSIIKFYLEYAGDKLQKKDEIKRGSIKGTKSSKTPINPKTLEEKIWILSKL
jgi:hypothetical protein